MKLSLQAGTLLLFCASFINQVNACTCLDYGVPTCALFSRADAVFVGKIERITSAMEAYRSVLQQSCVDDRETGLDLDSAIRGHSARSARRALRALVRETPTRGLTIGYDGIPGRYRSRY